MVFRESASSVPAQSSLLRWSGEPDCLAAFRAFAPELHVCDSAAVKSFVPFGLPPGLVERLAVLMREEGYLQLEPPAWNLPLPAMAATVERLQQLHMPTPLCFVYDEFWLLFAKLHGMISALLGTNYKRLPDFWAWCVGGQGDEAGWAPHRDKDGRALNPDGSPRSLTVWIPLTDSTPLNGCMYIIPADRDRSYPTGTAEYDPADIRALPAAAGSILLWNQAVYHWGGRRAARHQVPPRTSVAFEFQSGDIPPFNQPLLNPLEMPNLGLRMRLIAKQVLQYAHMYPLAAEVAQWAEKTLGQLGE